MKLDRLSPKARVGLIIFLMFAILILSENLIRLIARVSEETVVKIDEKKEHEIYMSTEEYKNEVYIEASIEKTIQLLKSGDYETLLETTDSDYAKAMNLNSAEELRIYLLEYFGNPEDIKLIDFEKIGGRFICTVNVKLTNEMMRKVMIVTPKDDDTFTVIFDNVLLLKNYDGSKSVQSGKIKYELISKITREGDYICTFEMTNQTNKTIEGSLENMVVVRTDRVKYSPADVENLKEIVLAPGETKFLSYRLDTSMMSYLADDRIEFIFVEKNGTEHEDILLLESH